MLAKDAPSERLRRRCLRALQVHRRQRREVEPAVLSKPASPDDLDAGCFAAHQGGRHRSSSMPSANCDFGIAS